MTPSSSSTLKNEEQQQEGERRRRRRARTEAVRALALAVAGEAAARLRARQQQRQQDRITSYVPLDLGPVAALLGGLARLKLYPPGSDLVPRLADEAGLALQSWKRRQQASSGPPTPPPPPAPPKMSQLGRLGTALVELGCPPPSAEWRAAFAEAAAAAGTAAQEEHAAALAAAAAEGSNSLDLAQRQHEQQARMLKRSMGSRARARRRTQQNQQQQPQPPPTAARTFPVAPEAVAAVGAALAAWRGAASAAAGGGADALSPAVPDEAWARRHWALLASPPDGGGGSSGGNGNPPPLLRPGEALAAQLSLPQLVQLMRAAAVLGGVIPVGGGGGVSLEEAEGGGNARPRPRALTASELAACLVRVLERRALQGPKGRGAGATPSQRNAARPELLAAALGALADVSFGGARGAWLGWRRAWLRGRQDEGEDASFGEGSAPSSALLFTPAEADEMLLRARVALAASPGRLSPGGVAELCWAVARLLPVGAGAPSSPGAGAWADEASLRLNDVSPGLGPRGLARAVAASAAAGRAPFSSLWRALYARWRVEAGAMARDDALLALEALAALLAADVSPREDNDEDAAAAALPLTPTHEQSARARRQRQQRERAAVAAGGSRRVRAGGATGVPDTEALEPLLAALRRAAALGGGGGGAGGAMTAASAAGRMSPSEMRRAALLLRRIYGGVRSALPGRGAERLVSELEARAAFLEGGGGAKKKKDDEGRARRRRASAATPFDDA
jgi:hypothetical protein